METCSSMWLFYILYYIASWLQMADVCSGLTEPAVGVGPMTCPLLSEQLQHIPTEGRGFAGVMG